MQLLIHDAQGTEIGRHEDLAPIAAALKSWGIFVGDIAVGAAQGPGRSAQVNNVQALASLHQRFGIRSADRVNLQPGDSRWPALRAAHRRPHKHADLELRVFLRGRGLFVAQGPAGQAAQLLCGAGEWVALPAGLAHAFDGGKQVDYDMLRLFSLAGGEKEQTCPGADKAAKPDLDQFVAEWEEALMLSA